MSAEIVFKGSSLDKMGAKLRKYPSEAEKVFRQAVFYVEKVIKKDFMSVQDGHGKRTTSPGVRAPTGNLRRSVRSVIIQSARDLEGHIGTDVFYGKILEEKTNYKYLEPGLEKARPEVKRLVESALQRVNNEQ